jgi:hypothetical protein
MAAKCAALWVVATVLLLSCSILAISDDLVSLFFPTAAVCVIIISSLGESLFPFRREHGFWLSLAGGIGRGALVGLSCWGVMTFFVSILSDPGDKFGIYVVVFSPAPAILGAITGGIARCLNYRKRKTEINPSSPIDLPTMPSTNDD